MDDTDPARRHDRRTEPIPTREAGSHATPSRSRRRFLGALAATGTAVGLAGCLGGLSDAGKRRFAENPVAAGVEQRPRRGPPREASAITLVAFDDPSCPSCADLHDGAFQRIETEWLATGRATLYSRMRPTVADWGRPAYNALLEAAGRDMATYLALEAAYYEHQGELTADNVAEKTGAFLADADSSVTRSVDPAAIVRASRERPHAATIDADAAAAKEAGINGVPTVFVFREGEFVTTLGNDRFAAYRSAVESHA